jgi:hypothetical protein
LPVLKLDLIEETKIKGKLISLWEEINKADNPLLLIIESFLNKKEY